MTRQTGVRDGTVPTPPDVFPTRAFPNTDFTLAGAYAGDEIGFADGAVTLYPVLRFDHFSLTPKADPLLTGFAAAKQSGSRLSPKVGAVVKPGGGFSLFANYAQGFKAPSPTQVNQFFQNLAQGYTSIPNPDLKLIPGSTFSISVQLPGQDSPVVPALAIQWDRQGAFVWRVTDKNLVERVNAAILDRNGDNVFIDAQLKSGDKVVKEGGSSLRDGQTIRPQSS